jgi:RimJ/RimL family protein N-acetyltransferase
VSLADIRLRTERLEVRLPTLDELVALFRVAEEGIHPPELMPFAVAWTDDLDLDRFLAFHAEELRESTPEDWSLNLVTFVDGSPIGSQTLAATGFALDRVVRTGSWLGAAWQGRGLGTEMRAAVLELAFRGLGARAALSGYFEGNDASRRVSEKLGYHFAGVSAHAPRGVAVPHTDLRLDRDGWRGYPVEISGLDVHDFGL